METPQPMEVPEEESVDKVEEDELASLELDISTVYVSFSAEINANTTESLISTMANLANQGVEAVHLLLSTPGGNIMNGINIYNLLQAMPFHLTTHNVGTSIPSET